MNRYDEKTLARWEFEVDEKDELLARKHWLLLHHPDFIKELREVEQAAGKRLPWGRVLPPERILDYRNHLRELNCHGTSTCAFMVKYDFIPEILLVDDLAKLRKLAKECGWHRATEFWLHARWYELNEIGKTDREIAEETLRSKDNCIDIDLNVLGIWQKQKPENFRKLCETADEVLKVKKREKKNLYKLKLLYCLGRFNLGRAKGNLGWPARKYPPFDGGSEELQTNRLYLVYVNYEWPDQLFSQEPELPLIEELRKLRDEFVSYRGEYVDKNYMSPIRGMIRQAVSRMKKKIDRTYKFYLTMT